MLVFARAWPAWVCLAAGLLSLTPQARGETTKPEESASLSDLVMLTRQARMAGDNQGWLEYGQRVLGLAPDHPDLLISVARALAANGRLDDALAHLEDAVRRGAGFDLSTFAEFKSAADTARLRALREEALKNAAPVAPSEVFRKRVRECGFDERPVLHGFNDMVLARNGDVYATDTTTNAIYRLSGDGCKFDRILHDTALSFPNGIVLTPDESLLYVAHVEGISAVDVRTGKRTQLAIPIDAAVNSIDGLAWDGKEVLGIQGSLYFMRVVRIRLADDGLSVREVNTVSSRPPLSLNPTTGVVVGDHFYMVAGFPDAIAAQTGQPQPRSHILRARLR